MIQRILMLALVLLAFTMPTEAITFQDLKTLPQFKLVHQHEYEKSSAIVNDGGGMYVCVFKYLFCGGSKVCATTVYIKCYLLCGTHVALSG